MFLRNTQLIIYLTKIKILLSIGSSQISTDTNHDIDTEPWLNTTENLNSNLNKFDCYSKAPPWENVEIGELKSFIHSERKRDFAMYCAADAKNPVIDDNKSLKIIELQSNCIGLQSVIKFSGILDKSSLPKGPGTAHIKSRYFPGETYGVICYKTLPNITTINGNFKNGIPHGSGRVYYTDGSIYTGYLHNGSFHGPVKILTPTSRSEKQPLYFGIFAAGRPHGPAWIFTPSVHDGAFYVHFESGNIVTTPYASALVDLDSKQLFIGSILDSWQFYIFITLTLTVSYTHLTLPTNREV